ncbi:diaminopimelate decarboxylase, partial [Thermodesulfovibrionales bacterium]|nr:diaminopimelate decarboxylase [Thermodesulfovibrionales bacterium]
NPDVDPVTHPYISTGLSKHKFGMSIENVLEYFKLAKSLKNIKIIGIHKHLGSQISKISPFVDALKEVLILLDELTEQGFKVDYLNIGGGLGITYKDETPPDPAQLARNILPLLKHRKLTLLLEPGRTIAGNAGILVTKTLYFKRGPEKEFVIVDAGMNDLLRPALYGSYHHIQPVLNDHREKMIADIVGPVCESGDFFAKKRSIPRVKKGECLAIMSAGAYGFAMASNYNSRPRAAEVMVKGKEYALIRERETYSDLIKGEIVPEFV